MEMSIYEFLAGLEEDLVNFYKQLGISSRLPESNELIKKMIQQSTSHGDHILSLKPKHTKPQLNKEFFIDIHNNIKNSLFKEIQKTDDPKVIIEKLAKSEEQIGKLYKILSDHYIELSEHYRRVAEEILGFSEEENMHRDMVLSEKRKYQ